MFVQCEDDPDWEDHVYGIGGCAAITPNGYQEYCGELADGEGVSASEACPASCGTGCALTFDSCWNSPCQNGGVCVNLPGVRSLACDWANCAQGYWGAQCQEDSTAVSPIKETVPLWSFVCGAPPPVRLANASAT